MTFMKIEVFGERSSSNRIQDGLWARMPFQPKGFVMFYSQLESQLSGRLKDSVAGKELDGDLEVK